MYKYGQCYLPVVEAGLLRGIQLGISLVILCSGAASCVLSYVSKTICDIKVSNETLLIMDAMNAKSIVYRN